MAKPPDERPARRGWWRQGLSILTVIVSVAVLATLLRSRTTFEADRVEWGLVSMPDGRSHLWMPVGPEVSRRALADGPTTFRTTELKWISKNGSTVFGCIQNEIPVDVSLDHETQILDAITKQAASAAKTRIITQTPIRLAERWSGREVELESDEGSYAVIRYYIIKHRIYQLQAIVPKSRNRSRLIARFLNSFGYADAESESNPSI